MYSQSSRSASHKHVRRGEKKDKDHKSKESSRKQEAPLTHFSFLFIVNEFQIREFDDEGHNIEPHSDRYGNELPPVSADGYSRELIGRVWRYTNGVVAPAGNEFYWYRPEMGLPGRICGPIPDGSQTGESYLGQMQEYKTYSVFNCWRFLPCWCTDVDVSTIDGEPPDGWHSLTFLPPDPQDPGFTRILYPGGPQRHASGSNPSWIPHLLPRTFATPSSSAPQSTGLGGNLPIIIALLALTKQPGCTDDVFQSRQWDMNRFGGRRSPHADPDPIGPPRGVMVQVCCDSYNYNSTIDAIMDFEERERAIVG
ncbi:hypothetical protein CORC01_02810 [Colletotrichum orchidophilum]|uniref:Uncharacterized protein n=1 Tax=Colletotrichum orchidophilum TaxID=1209926 RepID=A0A1G4BKG3_9PEZI|nr:uncharacterized protein CORC01_02810 [Colletotrichum orchidophilum]OHF01932.1 hypothetical protein CORC01_02810 [Colletotrichum orchidophilum]